MKNGTCALFIFCVFALVFSGCNKANNGPSNDAGYVNWTFDNTSYKAAGNLKYTNTGGVDLIQFVELDPTVDQISIDISINGKDKGTFSFGSLSSGGGLIGGTVSGKLGTFGSFYNCQGQTVYTSGSIVISKWGQPGEWIEGNFSGKVVYSFSYIDCAAPAFHTISGTFKVKRVQ